MKKLVSVLMAVMLVIAMAAGACAEAAPELYATMEGVEFVDGTTILKYADRSGYGLCDLAGNKITEPIYSRSFIRSRNIFTAAQLDVDELNYNGAFLLDGTQVIPCKYGVVDSISECWAAGVVLEKATAEQYDYSSFSGDYYKITAVDIYNLESKTCVANLTRSDYASADAFGNTINIENRAGEITAYDANFNVLGTGLKYTTSDDYAPAGIEPYYENGQYGLKDPDGNIIMAPAYKLIYSFRYGYAVISDGDGEGMIDKQGNVVVQPDFDSVKSMPNMPVDAEGNSYGYSANGYFCIVKDGKLGYIDSKGNVTCEPKYSKDIMQINGISATYTDMEGKMHVMAADGVDTVLDGYSNVFALYNMRGMYYRVLSAENKYGLVDWHGNEILPCRYSQFSVSGDGQYVAATSDYKNYEIYKIDYSESGSAPAVAAEPEAVPVEEAPAAEAPADDTVSNALAAFLGGLSNSAPAEDTAEPEAAEEAPASEAPASVDTGAVKTLLDSAKLLVSTDAATNKTAAVSLITSAVDMLAGTNVSVSTLLDTAITMLNNDAAANGAAVAAILDSAASLL